MDRINRFAEEHTVLFYALLVFALWLVGYVVTGDPWRAVGAVFSAAGEGLRPMGETP